MSPKMCSWHGVTTSPSTEIHLPGYKVFTEGHSGQIRRAAQMIWEAERPLVYAGGGIILGKAHKELRDFVEITDAPAVCTLMGLGGLPGSHPNFISHAGHARQLRRQHGDVQQRPVDRAWRPLRRSRHGPAGSVRAARRVIHVDIDPAEIGKNRTRRYPDRR